MEELEMKGMYEGRSLSDFCRENHRSVWIKKESLSKKEDVYKKMQELAKKLDPKEPSHQGIFRFRIFPYQKVGSMEVQILPYEGRGKAAEFQKTEERQLILPSLKNLFCINKEGTGISVYRVFGKEPLLSRCGSMEKGDEMLFYSDPKERMASLFGGKSRGSYPLLIGREALSEYSYIYEKCPFGFSFYSQQDTGVIESILFQSMKKYADISKEETCLLSYPEIDKEDLLQKGLIFKAKERNGFFQEYFLEQLTEKAYRLSFVVERASSNGSFFEVSNQIFLYMDEKGSVFEACFVWDFDGQWRKLSRSLIQKGEGRSRYRYISEENTGFLRYLIKRSSYLYDLKRGYQVESFEKLMSLEGIYQAVKNHGISSYLAFPKKSKLDEAFGLSLGCLHQMNAFAKQKALEDPVFQKAFRNVLKSIKRLARDPRMARINQEDFKKLLFFLFFNLSHFYVLEKVYAKKEALFEKTMDAAKDFVAFWEKQQEEFLEILMRKDQFLIRLRKEYLSLWEEAKKEKGSLFLQMHSFQVLEISEIFYQSLEFLVEKKRPAQELLFHLDEYLADGFSKITFYFEFTNRMFFLLFLDPERKEALKKYTDSFSEDDSLKEILMERKNIRFLNYSYPGESDLNHPFLPRGNLYYDFLDMILLFSPEEIVAMDLSFKCSVCPDKIKLQHDRLKTIYELRKNEHLDLGIAKAKESFEKLEYDSEEFLLRMPGSFVDLAKEGATLGHCVATYGQKVANGETKIFFVRKKEDPERPYFTVELLGKRISQIQGANLLRLSESIASDAGEEAQKVYAFLSDWAKKHHFEMI